MEPESKHKEQIFRQDLAVGASAKEILKGLLESSGYTLSVWVRRLDVSTQEGDG